MHQSTKDQGCLGCAGCLLIPVLAAALLVLLFWFGAGMPR